MGQITISFLGLCTYFHNFGEHVPLEFYTTPRRVVLANASNVPPPYYPHVAKIQMTQQDRLTVLQGQLPEPSEQTDSYVTTLTGATLSVINAIGQFGPEALCLPQLSAQVRLDGIPDPQALPPPNEAVYAANPCTASCYFDFGVGTMNGRTLKITGDKQPSRPPGIAQLVIETSDTPLLQIVPFKGSTLGDVPILVRIPPAPGTTMSYVNITNFAPGDTDKDDDFQLNALLLERVKGVTIASPTGSACPLSEIAYDMTVPNLPIETLTPGCSTSGYP